MTRREAIAGVTASMLAVGFDVRTRTWVPAAAAAARRRPFDDVPPLDGSLHTDDAARDAVAHDVGNLVHRRPVAVLRPKSAADIRKMVQFCRRRGIPVSARGAAHTVHGQGLTCGLLIEMRSLSRIHAIGRDSAEVDAGVLWRDLVEATVARGLTPPVLTGYLGLTVGGTLSVGGVAKTNTEGLQVDRVRELEVVTGAGDLVRCSMHRRRQLFEAALAGLGQCAIITRAVIDLMPAPARARTYRLHYLDNATYFRDQRMLLERGELPDVWTEWFPTGTALTYGLNATAFFNIDAPPDDSRLLRGLSRPSALVLHTDSTYLEYVQFVDFLVNLLRLSVRWDDLLKPWLDVWLPDASVERYIGDVIPTLSPLDVGPGEVLLFPQRRDRLRRPLARVPERGRWVWLFDILNASLLPGPDKRFVASQLARNRRLFDKARDTGGTRYPIGALDFTTADWHTHYGDHWEAFARSKQRYDPAGILTPGPGVFGP